MAALQPEAAARLTQDLIQLRGVADVVALLRAPGGCPWDAEQTHISLVKHLESETAELADAIKSGIDAQLADELGDVLLQVLLHAEIAAERGAFTLGDVAKHLEAKLVRRHPHVFGDVIATTSDEVLANWKHIKQAERRAISDGHDLDSLSPEIWAEYLKG